jgi:hypothetical protein
MRFLPLLLALLLVAPACGRKKQPPAPPPVSNAPVGPPKVQPPPGVPAALGQLLDREWPLVAKDGAAFLAKFKEFESARAAGDRSLMSSLAEDAGDLYEAATERWALVVYWPDEQLDAGKIDEATRDACVEFLRKYEKDMKEWQSKSKVIKEFTTVK